MTYLTNWKNQWIMCLILGSCVFLFPKYLIHMLSNSGLKLKLWLLVVVKSNIVGVGTSYLYSSLFNIQNALFSHFYLTLLQCASICFTDFLQCVHTFQLISSCFKQDQLKKCFKMCCTPGKFHLQIEHELHCILWSISIITYIQR